MNDFVVLSGKTPVVRTFDIFKGFGYSGHRELKNLIKDHLQEFEKHGDLVLNVSSDTTNKKRGGQEKSYLLNEQQFILLIMLAKNTPESIGLKQRIVEQFFMMREELSKISSNNPYIEQVRKILLLDAPTEWVKLFPPEYYVALMQLYGKQFISNKHTPPYCGAITKKWIYDVVLPAELNNEIDAQRKDEQKHRWFKEKGREILLKQIYDVTSIARQSHDRKEFEARCASMFSNEPFQLMLMI